MSESEACLVGWADGCDIIGLGKVGKVEAKEGRVREVEGREGTRRK